MDDVMIMDEKRRMEEMLLDGAQSVEIEKLVDDDEIVCVQTAQRIARLHIGVEGRKNFFPDRVQVSSKRNRP